MGKFIKRIFKTETLRLSECKDGFFLYDYVLGMNISIRAKSEHAACIEALLYYQRRLKEVKEDYKVLSDKVGIFISQVIIDDE